VFVTTDPLTPFDALARRPRRTRATVGASLVLGLVVVNLWLATEGLWQLAAAGMGGAVLASYSVIRLWKAELEPAPLPSGPTERS
jgi:hypothetical protein